MKKGFILLLCFMFMGVSYTAAQEVVEFSVGIIDEMPLGHGHGKAPLFTPSVLQDGNLLNFQSVHPDYTLILLDEDDETAYTVAVPAGTSTVVFPSWLQGNYKLCLVPDNSAYYYYGYIVL